jgi:hypothetical protein
MSESNAAPNVKIIPPLVYLAGIVIGFLASILMPTKVIPNSVTWTVQTVKVRLNRSIRNALRPARPPQTGAIGPSLEGKDRNRQGRTEHRIPVPRYRHCSKWGAALNVAVGRVPSVCSRVLENGTNCGGRTKPSYLPANGANVVCSRRERRGTLQPQ